MFLGASRGGVDEVSRIGYGYFKGVWYNERVFMATIGRTVVGSRLIGLALFSTRQDSLH